MADEERQEEQTQETEPQQSKMEDTKPEPQQDTQQQQEQKEETGQALTTEEHGAASDAEDEVEGTGHRRKNSQASELSIVISTVGREPREGDGERPVAPTPQWARSSRPPTNMTTLTTQDGDDAISVQSEFQSNIREPREQESDRPFAPTPQWARSSRPQSQEPEEDSEHVRENVGYRRPMSGNAARERDTKTSQVPFSQAMQRELTSVAETEREWAASRVPADDHNPESASPPGAKRRTAKSRRSATDSATSESAPALPHGTESALPTEQPADAGQSDSDRRDSIEQVPPAETLADPKFSQDIKQPPSTANSNKGARNQGKNGTSGFPNDEQGKRGMGSSDSDTGDAPIKENQIRANTSGKESETPVGGDNVSMKSGKDTVQARPKKEHRKSEGDGDGGGGGGKNGTVTEMSTRAENTWNSVDTATTLQPDQPDRRASSELRRFAEQESESEVKTKVRAEDLFVFAAATQEAEEDMMAREGTQDEDKTEGTHTQSDHHQDAGEPGQDAEEGGQNPSSGPASSVIDNRPTADDGKGTQGARPHDASPEVDPTAAAGKTRSSKDPSESDQPTKNNATKVGGTTQTEQSSDTVTIQMSEKGKSRAEGQETKQPKTKVKKSTERTISRQEDTEELTETKEERPEQAPKPKRKKSEEQSKSRQSGSEEVAPQKEGRGKVDVSQKPIVERKASTSSITSQVGTRSRTTPGASLTTDARADSRQQKNATAGGGPTGDARADSRQQKNATPGTTGDRRSSDEAKKTKRKADDRWTPSVDTKEGRRSSKGPTPDTDKPTKQRVMQRRKSDLGEAKHKQTPRDGAFVASVATETTGQTSSNGKHRTENTNTRQSSEKPEIQSDSIRSQDKNSVKTAKGGEQITDGSINNAVGDERNTPNAGDADQTSPTINKPANGRESVKKNGQQQQYSDTTRSTPDVQNVVDHRSRSRQSAEGAVSPSKTGQSAEASTDSQCTERKPDGEKESVERNGRARKTSKRDDVDGTESRVSDRQTRAGRTETTETTVTTGCAGGDDPSPSPAAAAQSSGQTEVSKRMQASQDLAPPAGDSQHREEQNSGEVQSGTTDTAQAESAALTSPGKEGKQTGADQRAETRMHTAAGHRDSDATSASAENDKERLSDDGQTNGTGGMAQSGKGRSASHSKEANDGTASRAQTRASEGARKTGQSPDRPAATTDTQSSRTQDNMMAEKDTVNGGSSTTGETEERDAASRAHTTAHSSAKNGVSEGTAHLVKGARTGSPNGIEEARIPDKEAEHVDGQAESQRVQAERQSRADSTADANIASGGQTGARASRTDNSGQSVDADDEKDTPEDMKISQRASSGASSGGTPPRVETRTQASRAGDGESKEGGDVRDLVGGADNSPARSDARVNSSQGEVSTEKMANDESRETKTKVTRSEGRGERRLSLRHTDTRVGNTDLENGDDTCGRQTGADQRAETGVHTAAEHRDNDATSASAGNDKERLSDDGQTNGTGEMAQSGTGPVTPHSREAKDTRAGNTDLENEGDTSSRMAQSRVASEHAMVGDRETDNSKANSVPQDRHSRTQTVNAADEPLASDEEGEWPGNYTQEARDESDGETDTEADDRPYYRAHDDRGDDEEEVTPRNTMMSQYSQRRTLSPLREADTPVERFRQEDTEREDQTDDELDRRSRKNTRSDAGTRTPKMLFREPSNIRVSEEGEKMELKDSEDTEIEGGRGLDLLAFEDEDTIDRDRGERLKHPHRQKDEVPELSVSRAWSELSEEDELGNLVYSKEDHNAKYGFPGHDDLDPEDESYDSRLKSTEESPSKSFESSPFKSYETSPLKSTTSTPQKSTENTPRRPSRAGSRQTDGPDGGTRGEMRKSRRGTRRLDVTDKTPGSRRRSTSSHSTVTFDTSATRLGFRRARTSLSPTELYKGTRMLHASRPISRSATDIRPSMHSSLLMRRRPRSTANAGSRATGKNKEPEKAKEPEKKPQQQQQQQQQKPATAPAQQQQQASRADSKSLRDKSGKKTSSSEQHQHQQNSPRTNSKSTTGKAEYSDGRSRQREFFKEELRRLEGGLKRESSKIVPPSRKKYTPFVFNTLEPYYNTHTTRFLIELPEEQFHTYTSRNTAIGLCDPWVDLRMDQELLPQISSRPVTRHDTARSSKRGGGHRKDKKSDGPSRKEGSTRLPKFPVVTLETKELATKKLYYSDVPMLRQELKSKYSSQAKQKVDEDYKRTQQDFYRMELDKVDQVAPGSRRHLTSTYMAYLQNTPGSRRAVSECVQRLEGKAN